MYLPCFIRYIISLIVYYFYNSSRKKFPKTTFLIRNKEGVESIKKTNSNFTRLFFFLHGKDITGLSIPHLFPKLTCMNWRSFSKRSSRQVVYTNIKCYYCFLFEESPVPNVCRLLVLGFFQFRIPKCLSL